MTATCLFCSQPLSGWIVPEHIVPESIGGWITTRSVCNPCNYRFGGQIDSFAQYEPFLSLRREAGLSVPDTSPVTFFDQSLGEVVHGRRRADGRVEGNRTIFDRGDRFVVQGRTPEHADQEFKRYADRQAKRGISVRMEGRRTTEEAEVVVRIGHDAMAESRPRLLRSAAKSAIEYLAYAVGDPIALDPVFDPLRMFASEGHPDPGVMIDFAGGSTYLPRTEVMMTEARSDAPPPDDRDRVESLRAGAPNYNRLTQIVHRLVLVPDGQTAQFHLWLFGWVFVVVPLPWHAGIPTWRLDYRDFTHRRRGTLYA
jgi:hypothetical protein